MIKGVSLAKKMDRSFRHFLHAADQESSLLFATHMFSVSKTSTVREMQYKSIQFRATNRKTIAR